MNNFSIFELQAILKFIRYAFEVDNIDRLCDGDNIACDYLGMKKKQIEKFILEKAKEMSND